MASTTSNVAGAPERREGRAIHYKISYSLQGADYGTDGAIVLLHDIPSGAFSWDTIVPQLAGLNRAVYAFDLLGYGQSEHPWPADTSIWGQADALSYLLKELNLTNVVFVGHGLGGGIAQVLATRLYRQQTAALVLVDTICYLHSFAENWPLPEMEKKRDFDAPKEIELAELMQQLRTTLPEAVTDAKSFGNVIDAYIEPWDSELGKEVLFQHLRNLVPFYMNSVSSDLKVFGKPTLIIWGDQDTITPVTYADRLHREIPGSELVMIPGANHLVLFDAPDAVAGAINDFVKKI